MPVNTVHVVEDEFHRLQTPSEDDPHTDENFTNTAQLALWNCVPALRGRVHASVERRHATLTGSVETAQQRADLEKAVLGLAGITGVTNLLEILHGAPGEKFRPDRQTVTGEPMFYVTRYCGLDAPSVSAAISAGLATLEGHLAGLELPYPGEAVVIYRNRLKETVTLDVGLVVSSDLAIRASEDIKSGRTPEGLMLSTIPGDGIQGLLDAYDRLLKTARLGNLLPTEMLWQRFPLRAAHHAVDRAGMPVFLPIKANSPGQIAPDQ